MTTAADVAAHLDTIDWERLSALPRLCLHRTLLAGLADPVPMPSPMTEPEAAWVRENAWTKAMRSIDEGFPFGFYRWCSCQHGTCWNCLGRRCDLCVHRQLGGPQVDADAPCGPITDARGFVVARVLLAEGQRPCRWVCRCPCRKTGTAHKPPRRRRSASAMDVRGPAAPTAPRTAQPAQLELLVEAT